MSADAAKKNLTTYRTLLKLAYDRGGHAADVARKLGNRALLFEEPTDTPQVEQPRKRRGIELLSWTMMRAFKVPPYTIDGLICSDAVTCVVGKPKSGKTFWSLDASLCVATGLPFHRRKVKQGRVLYIIAEGGVARFRMRVAAWCKHHGVDPATLDGKFDVVARPLNLLASATVDELLELLGNYALVVVDTLARTMVGRENDTEVMSLYVAALDRIRAATTATILVVHHVGWGDTSRGRGASSLAAAIDKEILIAEKDGVHAMRVTLDRNGPGDLREAYTFVLVPEAAEPGDDPTGVLELEGKVATKRALEQNDLTRIREKAIELVGQRTSRLIEWAEAEFGVGDRRARELVNAAVPEGEAAATELVGYARVWRQREAGSAGNVFTIHVDPDAW